MTDFTFEGNEIEIGYPWSIDIQVDGPTVLFPEGCALIAQVRKQTPDSAVLATMSTGNGGITRVSDTEITMALTATQTATLTTGYVTTDLVRSDTSPATFVGLAIDIPVLQPATRAPLS